MSWSPNPASLQQLSQLLALGVNGDPRSQQTLVQGLEEFQRHPEFMCYLATLLCTPDVDRVQRQLAGITLKNFIRRHYGSAAPHVKQFVKQTVVRALGDAHVPVRRAVALCVVNIVSKEEGFSRWPGLLEGLVNALQQKQAPALCDGALYAVEMLCEDATRELQDHPARPLNTLVPILIGFVKSEAGAVRLRCLGCLNCFLTDFPNAIRVNAGPLLEAVFASANDPDGKVTREVCRTFCTLVDLKPDYIAPYFGSVLNFMLAQMASRDEETRTEAADFWTAAVEQSAMQEQVKQRVPQLLPMLLEGMVYSEEEVEELLERDDSTKPLPDRDVAPFFAKSRTRGSGGDDSGGGGAAEAGDPSLHWSLRKASAAALDAICTVYGDVVLGPLMPLLGQRLQHADWRMREAAVLALGASADGTINGMVPMLPQLTTSLLAILGNAQSPPLLVAISCWALSRLCSWIVRLPPAENSYLANLVRVLSGLAASKSRRVQEASCSALAVVAEETWAVSKRQASHNTLLLPHAAAILTRLMAAYPGYQAKALLIMYDTLHAILAHLPENADMQRGVATVVLPPLMQCWGSMPDTDRRLIPLMSVLCSVALSSGQAFQTCAPPVVQRSLQMAALHMAAYAQHSRAVSALETEVRAQRPDVTPPELRDCVAERMGSNLPYDLDFVIAALDLVSAICDALGNGSAALLQRAAQPLVQLLGECMSCADVSVKQAAFALVGDMCRWSFEVLAPASLAMVPLLIDNLYGSYTNLCVNAAWALGEMSDRLGPRMAQHTPDAVTRIVRVLRSHHDPLLLRNLSIALARLAVHSPQHLAQRLEEMAAHWLPPLCQIKFGAERERAHAAVLVVLKGNPGVALQQLSRVAALMHSWGTVALPQPVRQAWSELVALLRTSPGFNAQWALVPNEIQEYCQRI